MAAVSIAANGTIALAATAAAMVVDIAAAATTGALALTGSAAITVNPGLRTNGRMFMQGSAALTIKNSKLAVNGQIRLTGSAALTVKNTSLAANGQLRLNGSAVMNAGVKLTATGRMSLTGAARATFELPLSATGKMVLTKMRASLSRGRDALGVCDVTREILLLWNFEYPCKAPDWAKEVAVTNLNTALQILWNRARDRSYWTQETLTLTLTSGQDSIQLADTVQNVVGPARIADSLRPLVPIGSRSEFDQFVTIFLDGDDSAGPQGYYIDRGKQAANDPARCTLMVSPPPSETTEFFLDVVSEAPRFAIDDISTCPRIPIPHRYVESLLLPICRWLALRFHLANPKPEARKQIEDEYAAASVLLSEADPLPGKAGDNHERRKDKA